MNFIHVYHAQLILLIKNQIATVYLEQKITL